MRPLVKRRTAVAGDGGGSDCYSCSAAQVLSCDRKRAPQTWQRGPRPAPRLTRSPRSQILVAPRPSARRPPRRSALSPSLLAVLHGLRPAQPAARYGSPRTLSRQSSTPRRRAIATIAFLPLPV